MIKMRPVPACYTYGRGALKSLGLGHFTIRGVLLPQILRGNSSNTGPENTSCISNRGAENQGPSAQETTAVHNQKVLLVSRRRVW